MSTARCRGEGGQVGGIEALPFGILIFVVGSLLIANAWAVVDAKFATDAAARQAARTFVEGSDLDTALHQAEAAALEVVAGHGRDPGRATVRPSTGDGLIRCARASFEVRYEVPALTLPFVGGYGPSAFVVRSSHSELVDPFRSGLRGVAEACR